MVNEDNTKMYDQEGRQRIIPFSSFMVEVSKGNVPGHSVIDKFGENSEITTGTDPEDIWDAGGIYTFSSTADITQLSSSNNSDEQDIKIYGISATGENTIQTITLTGTTPVELETPLWRVYRMENEGTVDIAGVIYLATSAATYVSVAGVPDVANTIRAIINNGNNQTLMSIYTVPKGYVGFLYRGEAGISKSGGVPAEARMSYRSRRLGKVFKVKKKLSTNTDGSSTYQDYRTRPDPIPAYTDILIRVDEVSATIGCWATFDIILIDENYLTKEFLTAIGQPTGAPI